MLEAFQGLMGWGLQYSSVIVKTHRNQGGTRNSYTAAMKFCAVVFLVYLAIGADASERKKNCKQILDKFSDL